MEDKYLKAYELSEKYKKQGKKIVFTNGCFDIIHAGHVDYLRKASSFGDTLFVGLNSDLSVRRLKGENRPINDEKARSLVLEGIKGVERVFLFDEDTPAGLIESIVPDILVKGGDYLPEEVVGRNIVEDNGGKVVIIPFLKGFSTTSIIERIKRVYG